MISKKHTLVVLFLLLFYSGYSQNSLKDIEGLKKNAISFNILGPTPVIGITYERIIASKFSMEIGVGFPSAGLGFKIYPLNVQVDKPMFHVGVTATYFASQESEMTPRPTWVIYIPIGMSVFKRRGFNFVIDFGPGYAYDRFIPYGNIKLGKRF